MTISPYDENAILVTGGTVAIDGATVTRASEDNTGGDSALTSLTSESAVVDTDGETVSVVGPTA